MRGQLGAPQLCWEFMVKVIFLSSLAGVRNGGILNRSDGRLRLAPEVASTPASQFGVITPQDVEGETGARLYNVTRVEPDASILPDGMDRALLAEATLMYASDPRSALRSLVRHLRTP